VTRPGKPGQCLECGSTSTQRARGLCEPCYQRHRYRGTLDNFERPSRTADEVLDEWVLLRGDGHTIRQAAARLGMTHKALDQALVRAKRRGDPRSRRNFGLTMAGAA
jgi:hypothetical protein